MEVNEKRGPGRPKVDKTSDGQEEPKKGTKPGWRPASVLPHLKARHGFTAKWVSNDPGNITKKMAEGWILMKPHDNVGIPIRAYETPEANPLANEIRFRDLIAMMISDEDKEARKEWLRDETRAAQQRILHKTDEEFRNAGVQTYSPKGQAGRIVIE